MITNVSSESFEAEVLKCDIPVVVDFWASWCGPCKMFAPILEEFAAENSDKVKVCKVNVDEQPDVAAKYGIMSIPTVIVFKNGDAIKTSIGVVGKAELAAAAGI